MYRRDRDRRRRDDGYVVEEVYVEQDPYYYDERPNSWLTSLIGVLAVVAILAVIAFFLFRSKPRPAYGPGPGQATSSQDMKSIPIGTPLIDLKAVEEALWQTKAANAKDFKGWMKNFEDEVNAIYFATLRRQNPKADPASLMKKPARVSPERVSGLLYLYGYIDENNKPGYQNGEDKLLFVFQQTKPYDPNSKQLHYAMRDGSGYYYRPPGYAHSYVQTALFMNFFVYPAIWYGLWWRPAFVWWGTPFWNRGFFYNRYTYYYRSYPRYYGTYRRTYYTRHRPWGWNRGSYYRRGPSGRYYSRTSRYRSRGRSGTRGRYRSGTNRYRSGSRYRQRTNRYRSGSRTRQRTNRYRSRGSRYRSRGSRYRSGGRRRR